MQTKTTFGINQIGKPVPKWATWLFRITLYVCAAVTLGLTTLNVSRIGLTPQDVNDLVGVLSFITAIVHGLTRMFGITFETEDFQFNDTDYEAERI